MICGIIPYIQQEVGGDTMAMIKCDYCGEFYDDALGGTLDNGSPACPKCVEYEEAKEKMSTGSNESAATKA